MPDVLLLSGPDGSREPLRLGWSERKARGAQGHEVVGVVSRFHQSSGTVRERPEVPKFVREGESNDVPYSKAQQARVACTPAEFVGHCPRAANVEDHGRKVR
jgi:hypothetical protein